MGGEAPRSIRVRGRDAKILAYALDDISGVLRMTNWGGAVLCKKSGHHYSMYIKRRGGVCLEGLGGWLLSNVYVWLGGGTGGFSSVFFQEEEEQQ